MKIGILFSGQGAQYPGMIKDLYESESAAREIFDIADCALGRDISKICFEASQEELNMTHNTQPCMLAGDLASAMVLKHHGIMADAVAGFSLGEYAALAYAGAITLDAAFRIIQIRADAMQEAVPAGKGAMAAFVGATAKQVEDICARVTSGYVAAANYNSPIQTVVSGATSGVDEACELADTEGLRCVKLSVSAPFHCALMEPAARKLEEEFTRITFHNPIIPVYMNVDGRPVSEGNVIAELLVNQAMSPVHWVQTLENMKADGIDTFIECGAGKTLSGLVKKTLKDVKILRVENYKTLSETLSVLDNVD